MNFETFAQTIASSNLTSHLSLREALDIYSVLTPLFRPDPAPDATKMTPEAVADRARNDSEVISLLAQRKKIAAIKHIKSNYTDNQAGSLVLAKDACEIIQQERDIADLRAKLLRDGQN